MPVSLKKGQKVSLTKDNPGLSRVVVGLGWDVNAIDTGGAFDLDAAAFLLGENGKTTRSEDFVFYGNLRHPSGAVEHLGDNLTGIGDGDDEQIVVASNQGEPLSGQNSQAEEEYKNICRRLLGEEVPFAELKQKKGMFRRLSEIFHK